MSFDILAEDELCPIACAWSRPALIAWLDQNGIPFVIAKSGWPRVHRKALERAMGVRDQQDAAPRADFNFDAIR